MSYNILSLFAGCGGLDLGFKKAGFKIPVANEFNTKTFETLKTNHKDTFLIEGDINKIRKKQILELFGNRDVDGIIGGPPCQSWSQMGSSRGINDPRGQLFYTYIKIIKGLQPRFFLAENVAGMLSSSHKKAVQNIMQMFNEIGYNTSLTLVDAKDYGVAQERKRCFYIGFRKDLGINFIFPTGSTIRPEKRITMKDIIYDLRFAVPSIKNKHNPKAINNNEYFVGGFSPRYMEADRVRGWDQQAFTILASGRHCQLHPDSPPMKTHNFKTWYFEQGKEHLYRRLSVRDTARIQGFPDSFQFFYNNLDDAYKMIGNAVPVNLAYEIAVAIKLFLDGKGNEVRGSKLLWRNK